MPSPPTAAEPSASLEFLAVQAEKRQARDSGKSAVETRLAAVADYGQAIFSRAIAR